MPRMNLIKQGVFLFTFQSDEQKKKVLERRWTYFGHPLMPWTPEMDLDNLDYSKLPVWVQLPNLHLCLWNPKAEERITSVLGTPIATDRRKASRERLSFARVLVEMEIVESLPNEIPIMTPKGVLQQPVLFEWKPLKCKKCGRIGHAMDTCVAPFRRVWQVKNVPPVVSVPKATGSVVDRGKAVLDESRAANFGFCHAC